MMGNESNEATMTLQDKESRLVEILQGLKSVVVGFSGGVDSTYLAHMANKVLGKQALCVTAISASVPSLQLRDTIEIVKQFGLNHRIINSGEMENPEYLQNSPDRCYFCKSDLFSRLQILARQDGYAAVLDGTNYDDLGDYRPGRRAAGEFTVRSPLLEAKMTKLDIRTLSRQEGLPTWDKPALPCLASRIPYGNAITPEKLSVVDRGENILRGFGFRIFRVRHHGEMVRLEIAPQELSKALNMTMAEILVKEFKALGFKYVTLDLEGYRSGALNEVLPVLQEAHP
jgi:pyridinium-3,5-biscarboxylic acid mononucleotide sulfurtransferase